MSTFACLVTLTLLPSVLTGSVIWEDCGSTLKVTDLRITDCVGENSVQAPCVFIKGQSYDIEFDAIPNKASEHLPYSVEAKFLWSTLPLFHGDACNELSRGSCPIKENGLPFTFLQSFDMELPFPPMSTMITAKMESDAGETLICARLYIQIRSATPKVTSGATRPLASFFSSYFRSAPLTDEGLAPEAFFPQARTLYI